MSEIIGSLAPKHQSIMMGNHGLICWGSGVEDAFFKMEITDSYCRTLVVASQIPTKRTTIPPNEMQKLLEMKQKLGLPDERLGLKPAQLCECDPWEFIADKPVACATPAGAPAGAPVSATNAELEALVARITDEVVKSLQK
jgi:L-fuculose-phosphate aldolase